MPRTLTNPSNTEHQPPIGQRAVDFKRYERLAAARRSRRRASIPARRRWATMTLFELFSMLRGADRRRPRAQK